MLRRKHVGFTVIELLVVIGIIALLTSILIPVFFRLQQQNQRSSCVNNLREIGVALGQYHADYNAYPAQPTYGYLNPASIPNFDQTLMPFDNYPMIRKLTGPANINSMQVTIPPNMDAGQYIVKISSDTSTTSVTNAVVSLDNRLTWSAEKPLHTAISATVSLAVTDMLTVPLDDTSTVNAVFAPQNYVGEASNSVNYDQWDFLVGVDKVGMGTFGLETLYRLYLNDKRDYLRSAQKLHCPLARNTEKLDKLSLWDKLTVTQAKPFRYDPLLGGYNTYDVTYNYNQYNQKIADFEAVVGNNLYSVRQLSNPRPPADTVVCFCYTHRDYGTPPDQLPGATEMDLVLWLDGTVEVMKPYNVQGISGPVQVPPCLYSRGEWLRR
ncbi:MAG: type II secretion system protein [bacterium]